MELGIIADTHGKLRPEAISALQGSEVILHAGDVGKGNILEELERIAPVHVVRGNIDRQIEAKHWPHDIILELGGLRFYMLHIRQELNFAPSERNIDVVVFGHSHKPLVEKIGGVLYLNPGSAGPRRFSLPVTLARCTVANGVADVKIIDLI